MMMHTILLSILAVLQMGGVPTTKVQPPPPLPVVKAVGFGISGPKSIAGRIVGGQEAVGWIELSAPAPCVDMCGGTFVNGQRAGGMLVHVSSGNTSLVKVQPVTGMVLVPVALTRTNFTVLTSGVSTPTPVTISAWREGSPPQTTTLNVVPPSLTGLSIDQSTLISGAGAHGTLTFNGAPGAAGVVVATLSSSNPAAVQVPASVPLDVNKTVATFDLKTSGVSTNTPVNILASYRDRKENAALTVTPAALTKFDADANLQLNGAAPSSGAVINLSSADPAHASVAPTVTIPAGSNKAAVSITRKSDFSSHHVTISATYNGVTKTYDAFVFPNIKPDLTFKEVKLLDRFGNAITHPADSQPYKMCITFELLHTNAYGNYLYPTSTVLHVAYLSPTGTGTSAGHEFDLPVNFGITQKPDGSYTWTVGTLTSSLNDSSIEWINPPTCIDMPGISQPGSYTDVTLIVDAKNTTDETDEGNNTYKLRITRQ